MRTHRRKFLCTAGATGLLSTFLPSARALGTSGQATQIDYSLVVLPDRKMVFFADKRETFAELELKLCDMFHKRLLDVSLVGSLADCQEIKVKGSYSAC